MKTFQNMKNKLAVASMLAFSAASSYAGPIEDLIDGVDISGVGAKVSAFALGVIGIAIGIHGVAVVKRLINKI